MNALPRLRSFVRALVLRRSLERDMDDDLRVHVDERTDDLVQSGLARDEAARRARRELGDPVRWKEEGREARGVNVVDDLWSDVAYGVRWLVHSPAFAATAILSIALGIGANAAIFNLLNVVLLRSLPVAQPEQLAIYAMAQPGSDPGYGFSYAMFDGFRQQHGRVRDTMAVASLRMNLELGAQIEPTVSGQMVSGNYYELLGVPAAAGRLIQPQDDGAPGTGTVAVLSYGYWQRRFGADPNVVGAVARVNGLPFTIIGVSAPEFFGTRVGSSVDVTVPLSIQPHLMAEEGGGRVSGRGVNDIWLELVGRLAPGVTHAEAEAEADAVFQPLLADLLAGAGPKGKMFGHPHLRLEPGSRGLSDLRRQFSRPLFVLTAAVALVLLMACANVASLLLARASARRREMAVRVALGATRWRLARQLLTESLMLALAGGALGLLVARWTSQALASWLIGSNDTGSVTPDVRVLAFTFVLTAVTGVIFGLAPALRASSIDTSGALKDTSRGSIEGARRFGFRGLLVAAQVAISVVLLVAASLFVRTLTHLRQLDLGMDQDRVLALRLEPLGSNQKRSSEARLRTIYDAVLTGVRRVPGVVSASLTGATPLSDENSLVGTIVIPGTVPRAEADLRVRTMQIYPDYFATLGVPLLAGRELQPQDDRADVPAVTVINETMARRFFGTPALAVGRQVVMRGSFQIVGVVRDTRDRTLREEIVPLMYSTFAHTATGRGQMTLVVRTSAAPRAVAAAVRQIARQVDPTMPMLEVQTIGDRVRNATRREELLAWLSSIFGIMALILAAIGLYGVLAYTVARRQAEFGVRLALGATARGLEAIVLRDCGWLVGAGLIVGGAAALAGTRWIAGLLFGLSPVDPASFAVSLVVLIAVALAAAWIPARRAAKVDPVMALRG